MTEETREAIQKYLSDISSTESLDLRRIEASANLIHMNLPQKSPLVPTQHTKYIAKKNKIQGDQNYKVMSDIQYGSFENSGSKMKVEQRPPLSVVEME